MVLRIMLLYVDTSYFMNYLYEISYVLCNKNLIHIYIYIYIFFFSLGQSMRKIMMVKERKCCQVIAVEMY